MKFIRGGNRVSKGTYWNVDDLVRVRLGNEGRLPGGQTTRYVNTFTGITSLALVVVALIYSVALPYGLGCLLFFVQVGIGYLVLDPASRGIALAARATGNAAHFGWRPVASYLSGSKRTNKRKKK